jgi:uncharacterized membrane protein
MASLFAFLHHLAVFALVAALAVEFALVRSELTVESARRLQVADRVLGVAPAKMRAIRSIIHWELVGMVLILLCAALMARGVGFIGA